MIESLPLKPTFTPEPWVFVQASGCVEAIGVEKMLICASPLPEHVKCPANDAFFANNARLIAASPRMYAALKKLKEVADSALGSAAMSGALAAELNAACVQAMLALDKAVEGVNHA